MDGELHATLEPEAKSPLARVRRFTGLKPEGWVPIEIQAERSRRWTSRTLLTCLAVLALFNGRSVVSWASTLPPNWASVTVRELAQVWSDRMAVAGFDAPRAGLRTAWKAAKAVTWKEVGGVHVEVVEPKRR